VTTPSALVWVDGRVLAADEPCLPASDRGFLFADSVYETIRTYDRRVFLLGDHLDRLRRSAEALFLPILYSDEELTAVAQTLLEEWPQGHEASVRIVITRGDGGSGLSLPEPQRPRLVVLCRPLPAVPPDLYEGGVAAALPDAATHKISAIPSYVKSGSYLANILALREARAKGGFEALLRGPDGSFSEGTTSNFFVVKDSVLRTPTVSHILPGITRALVLAVAAEAGLSVREEALWDADLAGADEMFLTSSIKEIVPVISVDGAPVGDGVRGPVTTRLQARFQQAVQRLQDADATRIGDLFPR
jgi:branched-chain amino acid aminotransferase